MMRGADVSSDHHLLMTTVRLRFKRFTSASGTRSRYNVGLLRDKDTQAAFQISLFGRFQPHKRWQKTMRWTSKHSGNTVRSFGTTHVKRPLARRRHSKRDGNKEREENCAEQLPKKSS